MKTERTWALILSVPVMILFGTALGAYLAYDGWVNRTTNRWWPGVMGGGLVLLAGSIRYIIAAIRELRHRRKTADAMQIGNQSS